MSENRNPRAISSAELGQWGAGDRRCCPVPHVECSTAVEEGHGHRPVKIIGLTVISAPNILCCRAMLALAGDPDEPEGSGKKSAKKNKKKKKKKRGSSPQSMCCVI